tara:strand:+ start:11784 stop:11954 length:171 start_codon:yes stop_codon:yes gene_type:complete
MTNLEKLKAAWLAAEDVADATDADAVAAAAESDGIISACNYVGKREVLLKAKSASF